MGVRKFEVVSVKWKELSGAIQNEILPEDTWYMPGLLFWAYVPNTIQEIEDFPNWANYCKTEDLKPGQKILIS